MAPSARLRASSSASSARRWASATAVGDAALDRLGGAGAVGLGALQALGELGAGGLGGLQRGRAGGVLVEPRALQALHAREQLEVLGSSSPPD